MFIKNRIIKLTLCLSLVSCIAGCGTLLRLGGGGFDEGTYQAVNTDTGIIDSAWMWYLSFGIIPLVAAVSLPFDAVADTVFYPIDYNVYRVKNNKMLKEIEEKERQKELLMQQDSSHVYLYVYAINLASDKKIHKIILKQQPDVSNNYNTRDWTGHYRRLDNDKKPFIKSQQNGAKLAVSWFVKQPYTDNPHEMYSKEWYSWNDNSGEQTRIVDVPYYDEQSYLSIILLPCNQVSVVTILHKDNYHMYIGEESFKNKLEQLKKLEAENNCPVAK